MMKTVFVAAILIIFAQTGIAFAFHEGQGQYCNGCHSIRSPIIRGSDPSSTCLRCHAELGMYYTVLSDEGSMFSPGGDFYWLRKTFTWEKGAITRRSEGDNHGHNILSYDYELYEDSTLPEAPGGTYPSASLSCISCHDPHERSSATGNYRLLGGVGYDGVNFEGGIIFVNPAPIAAADAYDWTESDTRHVDYGSGMSEWCGNCHGGFLHNRNMHPAGNDKTLSPRMISNYNMYVKTGNMGGSPSDAYLALVPFERGTTDVNLLDPWSTSGPGSEGNANVMCLTCHRAHASAFNNIGRWDFSATFLYDSHPQYGDDGATGNDVFNSYYGRDIVADFGEYQRQLCNKCHVQD